MFSHPDWALCRWVWLYFPGPPLQTSCPPQTQARPPGRPHSRSRSSRPRQHQYSHRNHSSRPRQCPRSCHRCNHHPRNHRSYKYQDHPHLRKKWCFIHGALFLSLLPWAAVMTVVRQMRMRAECLMSSFILELWWFVTMLLWWASHMCPALPKRWSGT